MVYHTLGAISVVFLSLSGPLKDPAPALCLCPMGNEAGCQGICPGPHRETGGVACGLEPMTVHRMLRALQTSYDPGLPLTWIL